MLAKYYLSEEIANQGLSWLNPKALRLKKSNVLKMKDFDTVYCQVDQLEEFWSDYLPAIKVPIILISGKAELPMLRKSDVVLKILADPKILVWFSQNQTYKELEIRPFPYGVNLDSAPILIEIASDNTQNKIEAIHTPFVSIHPHLTDAARIHREMLSKFMTPKKPLRDYLRDIATHKWVVCPAGDRPDTFRHWETIALGSIPISALPEKFLELFEDSVIFVQGYEDIYVSDWSKNKTKPVSRLANLEYWRYQVNISVKDFR